MATRIPRVQQILDLSIETVNKMSAAELKKNVQILASAANKRLARLGSTEIGKIAPAYESAMKRSYTGTAGGKFGTAGKSRNQLLNEFVAIKSFMGLKTSSVKGWSALRKKTYEKAGVTPTDDPEREKALWRTFRKILELYPNMGSMAYGSDELKVDIIKMINGKTPTGILRSINAYNLKNRDFVIDEYGNAMQTKELRKSDRKYVVDDAGRMFDVDINDPEDILKIMELKVDMEYAKQQHDESDDEFFEL